MALGVQAARHQDAAGAAPAVSKKSNGSLIRTWSAAKSNGFLPGGQRADGEGAAEPASARIEAVCLAQAPGQRPPPGTHAWRRGRAWRSS